MFVKYYVLFEIKGNHLMVMTLQVIFQRLVLVCFNAHVVDIKDINIIHVLWNFLIRYLEITTVFWPNINKLIHLCIKLKTSMLSINTRLEGATDVLSFITSYLICILICNNWYCYIKLTVWWIRPANCNIYGINNFVIKEYCTSDI